MPGVVVQHREEPQAVAFLRKRGINPNAFAHEAFEARLRRLRAEERMRRLDRLGAGLPRPKRAWADIVREDRDR